MADTIEPPIDILLVEDNPNDAMLVETLLSRATTPVLPGEVNIHHEEALPPALEYLESESVDVMLLDLGLPASSGVETFDRLGNMMATLPIVVLTGLQDEEAAVELLKQGAQDYLTKDKLNEDRLVRSIRYALERQQQKEKLQTTNEQLEVLTQIMSHDIRNDLQIQQIWIEQLQDTLDGVATTEIERITESNKHIVELTENSREFMEFVAGDGDISREPTNLARLLTGELEKAQSVHENAAFTLEGSMPETQVYANQMLGSVFRNLFTNAVRHNDNPEPKISVFVYKRQGTIRITVTDNGPGVPDDRKDDIFGKGELGLESPGTGIGLYLVHSLVTAYQGRVWVEDREPSSETDTTTPTGSTFIVELEAV